MNYITGETSAKSYMVQKKQGSNRRKFILCIMSRATENACTATKHTRATTTAAAKISCPFNDG
jgi:hypothetical protein